MSITTIRKVIKMAEKVADAVEVDQSRRVIIKSPFVWGEFKEPVPDYICEDFEIVDSVMTIYATGDREPICDGSSLAPDEIGKIDTIRSSIGHDCMYEHLESIAEAWGWSVDDVRKLADDAFGCDLKEEAASQKSAIWRIVGNAIASVYHRAVRWFGGLYHNAKNGAAIIVAAMILTGCGCAIPDVFEPSGAEVDYIISNIVERVEAEKVEADKTKDETKSVDAIDYSLLNWKYGGFNGSKASAIDGCEIMNLNVTSSGLTYSWKSGGCEALGASDKSDYSHTLACLFCYIDGAWVGGKFDWISTSRTSRSFTNVSEGYNGWRKDAISAASRYAFVIVSKDGRKRSNVIMTSRK